LKQVLLLAMITILISGCNISTKNSPKPDKVKSKHVDNVVKILEKNGVEYAYPHWSKDGSKILFQSNETGYWQIFIMNSDGSNKQQITEDKSNNNFLDWSPDNKKICFVSDRTGNEEIFVMDMFGDNVKQLTSNPARDIHPYWSPDGKRIFFNSTRDDSGDFELYVMDENGSNKKRITYTDDNETCARLSPVSNELVFLRNNAKGLDEIFLKNLSDSSEKQLTFTPSTDGWPAWFPDGKKIIFSTKEKGIYKLHLFELESNRIYKISNPPHPYWDGRANVSSDGKKIVFNRQIDSVKNTIGIYMMYLK